jgi:hypothetical protein
VEELAARHSTSGPEAPGDRRRRNGRAPSLPTEAPPSASTERVRAPPGDGGVWGGPKVAARMARHLGPAEVHPRRGWEALRRIGRSIRAPRPRHARAATPDRQVAFEGGSRRRPRRPRRRILTARSRSGRGTAGRTASNRLGPKPIRRRVRAPVGRRPVALGPAITAIGGCP